MCKLCKSICVVSQMNSTYANFLSTRLVFFIDIDDFYLICRFVSNKGDFGWPDLVDASVFLII